MRTGLVAICRDAALPLSAMPSLFARIAAIPLNDRGKVDRTRPLDYDGERHILLFGVNGAGKSTRILIENLTTMWGRSAVVFDMKGELAAQTHRARRTLRRA